MYLNENVHVTSKSHVDTGRITQSAPVASCGGGVCAAQEEEKEGGIESLKEWKQRKGSALCFHCVQIIIYIYHTSYGDTGTMFIISIHIA